MIALLNLIVLVAATLLFLYYYIRSVIPAAREMVSGPEAYAECARDRVIAIIFEFITLLCYGIYFFFPLPAPIPAHFPWPWWGSLIIGALIGIPATLLMVKGLLDAGEEAARPKKEHPMYSGIYNRIRHPQAAGEVFLWLAIAFLLHSPFLAVYSLVYFPIFLVMCLVEENDLMLRFGQAYADYCRQVGAFCPKRKPDDTPE
jgi:protein-S-isoprenylcysteine O-methyltransferase Ste14